jgi:uncharacterized protein YecE (DUF72 family)
VVVGLCGFAERQARVFGDFDALEVQHTFYQPPRVATAARWRADAPPGYRFAVKAWQLCTHEARSPTYRRLREDVPLAECGLLRWNDTTRMAWARTQDVADALRAEAVVVQMPASFRATPGNLENAHRFFASIDRRGRLVVFEPRGETWDDATVEMLVREHRLVHGVDPFLRDAVGPGPRYWRLHGRPAYNYTYQYTDDELAALRARLSGDTWVMFNNDRMAPDARRFMDLLRRPGEPARPPR